MKVPPHLNKPEQQLYRDNTQGLIRILLHSFREEDFQRLPVALNLLCSNCVWLLFCR